LAESEEDNAGTIFHSTLSTDLPESKPGRCSADHRHTTPQIFVTVATFRNTN